jgi:hypothetical protein
VTDMLVLGVAHDRTILLWYHITVVQQYLDQIQSLHS